MLLKTYFDALELHRDDKFVSLRFLRPFRVISTSPANGGVVDDLAVVFNHQCCEPAGHQMEQLMRAHRRPLLYNAYLLADHGLAGRTAAGLGTAANMNNLCIAEERSRELHVVAFATGGVEGNAARAGDPASYYEYDGRFERKGPVGPDTPGTINVMVAVNTPMTEGALVRAVMTATEAKTSLLQELSVPSRQSASIATGTGTDQIAVMAPADGAPPLTSAGHHSVLGEMIGNAVYCAIKDTLALQNGLTPIRQCSCGHLLERFGVAPDALVEQVAGRLPEGAAALARRNRHALDRDPLTVAATAALIHLHDQVSWGVLPETCWEELATRHGAQIAVAVAGRPDRYADYGVLLADDDSRRGRTSPVPTVVSALSLGFADKWESTLDRLAGVIAAVEETGEAACHDQA